jgi:hypothetical protein
MGTIQERGYIKNVQYAILNPKSEAQFIYKRKVYRRYDYEKSSGHYTIMRIDFGGLFGSEQPASGQQYVRSKFFTEG